MERPLKKIMFFCLLLCLFAGMKSRAQASQPPAGQLELFCGLDLGYADTNWLRLYDVQLNATPGVKWHLGNDWMVAVQGIIPVVSDGYTFRDEHYKYWRGNMAVLTKQLHFNEIGQHARLSAGWFSKERYGIDAQWAWPVSDWLLLQVQGGLTAHWMLGADLDGNHETDLGKKFELTGVASANVYLQPWDIEVRASGGRYVNNDYGTQIDVMRHFSHCTLLMYAQLRLGHMIESQFEKYTYKTNGGFKVIVMLPPYKKSDSRFVARVASNFRLTNDVRSDGLSMKMYATDPEENERENLIDVDWGVQSQ